jgi:hypothetical protein
MTRFPCCSTNGFVPTLLDKVRPGRPQSDPTYSFWHSNAVEQRQPAWGAGRAGSSWKQRIVSIASIVESRRKKYAGARLPVWQCPGMGIRTSLEVMYFAL